MSALQEKDYSLYMWEQICQICISEKIKSLKWKDYLKPSMVQGIEMKKNQGMDGTGSKAKSNSMKTSS